MTSVQCATNDALNQQIAQQRQSYQALKERAARVAVDEATARGLLRSAMAVERLKGMQQLVAVLCRRHAITVQHPGTVEHPAMLGPNVLAYSRQDTRTVVIPPIVTEWKFAIALHEVGHILEGACSGREPHRRDPQERRWWNCIACETKAWRRALDLVPFTYAMCTELRIGLLSYRATTPASTAAIAELDDLASRRTYFLEKQRRVTRSLQADRRRLVEKWLHECRH